ncbi:unnamed protein product, partial [Notodromas monacha]
MLSPRRRRGTTTTRRPAIDRDSDDEGARAEISCSAARSGSSSGRLAIYTLLLYHPAVCVSSRRRCRCRCIPHKQGGSVPSTRQSCGESRVRSEFGRYVSQSSSPSLSLLVLKPTAISRMESASATLPWCFVLAAVVARFPHTSASAQAARSPPIIYGNIEPVVAISGESVKLYCPVGGDPTPFYEWFKNGEEILGDDVYADARNRIRIMGHALKIKRTRAEDSGIYECRAINGFGTVTVEVELFVQNKSEILSNDYVSNRERMSTPRIVEKSVSEQNDGVFRLSPGTDFRLRCVVLGDPLPTVRWFRVKILSNDYVSNRERMSTPRIVEKSVSEQNDGVFRLSPGTDFRLRCVVLGDPLPTVRWFREGMELKTGGWRDKSNSRWSHIFQPLRTSDSGEYSCRASSKSGQAAANFTVILDELFLICHLFSAEKIAGKSQTSSPVHALVTSSEFVNQSAIMGTNVALSCEVKSDSRLLLHWVKRVEESAEDRGAADADLIVFEGHSYRDVNGSSVMGSTDPSSGRPRLEVTLESVRRDTAGVYVCLATNDVGGRFQVKSVHLIVSETAPPREFSLIFPLYPLSRNSLD